MSKLQRFSPNYYDATMYEDDTGDWVNHGYVVKTVEEMERMEEYIKHLEERLDD